VPPVIPAYERDGSLPFPEQHRPLSDRRLAALIVLAVLAVAAVIGGALVLRGHTGSSGATTSSSMTPSTTQNGTDLSQVSNDEMEAVVAANPDVVPMRLALVERYLHAADAEQDANARVQQLDKAKFHAGEAAARATTVDDKARALRYLGWTTAMTTDPQQGASFLEQSLSIEPGNGDSLWYLAIVRFERLHDPAAAKPLLDQLMASQLDDNQRTAVQNELQKVTAALGAPTATPAN